ncbi:hypothetical protein KTN05_06625 [Paracoccus sp. Z118]|uniref:hypothetical protein n=1 Tax=Paracoccus sp. Z118 TaxID=2851017 RepID=UPI001C2CA400|nr:hypothetical protein [Paracoccus sp. Z118]MBV0891530.1 hypothetical protein [Paracoccus sp. Z118]
MYTTLGATLSASGFHPVLALFSALFVLKAWLRHACFQLCSKLLAALYAFSSILLLACLVFLTPYLYIAVFSFGNSSVVLHSVPYAFWEFLIPLITVALLAQLLAPMLLFARALASVVRLTEGERALLASKEKLISALKLSTVIGLPPFAKTIRAGKRRAYLLFSASALTLAAAFSIVQVAVPNYAVTVTAVTEAAYNDGNNNQSSTVGNVELAGMVISEFILFSSPLMMILLLRFSARLRGAARQEARQTLSEARKADARPPVLFLRSFDDDQVALELRGSGLATRMLRIGEPLRSLDHLIVEEFSRFGPVVALGRPSDKHQPFGAARQYLHCGDWRSQVRRLAQEATAIVAVSGTTPGMQWELDLLADPMLREKSLILVGPKHAACPELALKLLRHPGPLDRVPNCLGIFSSGGKAIAITGSNANEYAYRVAITKFFMGLPSEALGSRPRTKTSSVSPVVPEPGATQPALRENPRSRSEASASVVGQNDVTL